MRLADRPVLASLLGFATGVTLLLLLPNLFHDLFVRQVFSEFGSRGATVWFDFFVWGVVLVPAAVGFAVPLTLARKAIGLWPGWLRVGAGLACGLTLAVVAGSGQLHVLLRALFSFSGLVGHLLEAALGGFLPAVALALVAVATRPFAARRATTG